MQNSMECFGDKNNLKEDVEIASLAPPPPTEESACAMVGFLEKPQGRACSKLEAQDKPAAL